MKDRYKARCPRCNSTALEIGCTVSAKARYNVDSPRAYKIDYYNIDCWFTEHIKCLKCDWEGSEGELV